MKWLDNGNSVVEGDGIMKSNMDSVNNAMGGPQRTQDDAAVSYVYQRPPDPEFPTFAPKHLRWAHGDDTVIENHDKWKYPSVSQGAPSAASPSMQGPKIPTPPTVVPTGTAHHYGAALASLYDLGHNKQPTMAQLGPDQQLIYMTGGPQMGPHGPSGISMHHFLQQQTMAVQAAQQQTLRQVQQMLFLGYLRLGKG